jgi:hypothetical protein
MLTLRREERCVLLFNAACWLEDAPYRSFGPRMDPATSFGNIAETHETAIFAEVS